VHTEDSALIRHTVYESGSFVPLLQLQQAKGHKTQAQTLWSMGSDDEGDQGDEDQPSHQPQALTAFEGLPREQREMLQQALEMVMQPNSKALQGLPVNQETAQLLNESAATLKAAHDASAKAHPVTIRHYLTDHLGTPIALVDANGDKAGQVTWAASYNAWGDLKEGYNPFNLAQPIRFQGQQLDGETGLHYNRFRYYDPQVGRYITQDPIGLNGGVNTGAYPANPLDFVDPMGLNPTASPNPPFDLGKGKSRWDRIKAFFDYEKNIQEGIDKKIEHEKVTCKRAAEREKRYDEERQNKLEDNAAVVRDIMGGPISDAIEVGTGPDGVLQHYGYHFKANVPDCAKLLNPADQTPKIDFLKK